MRIFATVWPIHRKGARKINERAQESYESERLDHLGIGRSVPGARVDFRTIPEILEPGEEMWGVYEYQKGFGGYPIRFLATHDLVYQPWVYQAYRRLLAIKRWCDQQRSKKVAKYELPLLCGLGKGRN